MFELRDHYQKILGPSCDQEKINLHKDKVISRQPVMLIFTPLRIMEHLQAEF